MQTIITKDNRKYILEFVPKTKRPTAKVSGADDLVLRYIAVKDSFDSSKEKLEVLKARIKDTAKLLNKEEPRAETLRFLGLSSDRSVDVMRAYKDADIPEETAKSVKKILGKKTYDEAVTESYELRISGDLASTVLEFIKEMDASKDQYKEVKTYRVKKTWIEKIKPLLRKNKHPLAKELNPGWSVATSAYNQGE